MSENDMRQKVVKALKPLDAVSIENPIHPGTPDVNYLDGWLELKWTKSWPVNETTPLRFDHYTPQQRVWLLRRARAGGKVGILLQVQREWFLFTNSWVFINFGKLTRKELIQCAHRHWKDGFNQKELCSTLISLNPNEMRHFNRIEPYEILFIRRKRQHRTQTEIADFFNVTYSEYVKMEHGTKAIPASMIKLDSNDFLKTLMDNEIAVLCRRRSGITQKELAKEMNVCLGWIKQLELGLFSAEGLRRYWSEREDSRYN